MKTHTASTETMATASLQPLLKLLESKGISSRDVLASCGIDASVVESPSRRIEISTFDRLMEQLIRMSRETSLGIHAGREVNIQQFPLLGFLIGNCQTLREVMATLRRYYTLITDSRSPEFFIGHGTSRIVYHFNEGKSSGNQFRAELIASAAHTLGNILCGKFYQLQDIGFRHPAPANRDQVQKFFQVPVHYDQAQNWISFSSQYIDSPLMYSNSTLITTLQKESEKAMERYSHMQSFSQRIMFILNEWPETIAITKEAVAELINTSSRTLTRRLQEEGYQFSNLVKEVRLEKAMEALKFARTDVQQLALNLGFSDRRGFERAFKQWTGLTPAAYRRSQIGQGHSRAQISENA